MYCTYKTSHPSGLYYFGKGMVENVKNKDYKGSGKDILKAFKLFPKEQWITDILQEFEINQNAYDHEAILVTEETLKDPKCLNRQVGGGPANRTPESYLAAIETKRANGSNMGGRPFGYKVKRSTKLKIIKARLGTTRSDESKKKMSEKAKNRKKIKCPHCKMKVTNSYLSRHNLLNHNGD